MARDVKKKQRKIQKQKAKKKAEKKAIARRASLGIRGEFELAARYPVLHCCEFTPEVNEGLTNLLISRRVGGGNVAFALFLIDCYCLGVKNITASVVPEGTYTWNIYDKLNNEYDRYDMSAADICKLVEDAVEYAHSLGIAPHSDYRKVHPIFADADPGESEQEFVFGKNGMPHYITGPYDTPAKIERTLATLREHCGEGNFHFMIMATEATMRALGDGFEAMEEVEGQVDDDRDW